MKFSEAWLREWVDPALTTQQLVDQLTMAGLEVDATLPVAGEFSGVVVGQIISLEPHPDADKLRVCQVAGGDDKLTQVVCGAPNARAGLKIPFALVGAVLPPGEDGKAFKIKKAKLRGVDSFGMLCGQTELQAGDDDSGLWELAEDAPVGVDLRDYLKLDDSIIEVDLTPNRSDCLSLRGLAREVATLNATDYRAPLITPVDSTHDEVLDIVLDTPQACPRYLGRVIKNIDLNCPSPLWLQEKLRRSGIQSIDAVVDVTNYVLMELGQPMHAFDLAKLSGRSIHVRSANEGEELVLLNKQTVSLSGDTTVIADDSGALAIAGVMGGESTAISSTTTSIFLECAFFSPLATAGKARHYGLHTDSSHRFERGVDYAGLNDAIERASQLIVEIVGGEAGPVIEARNEQFMPRPATIDLRRQRIESGLGFAIDSDKVEQILTGLGLHLEKKTTTQWTFIAPTYRFDLAIEEDLLEELARVYGYNQLPTTDMSFPLQLADIKENSVSEASLHQRLLNRDYHEVISYSFIDGALSKLFYPDVEPIALLNPISADMGVMRTSLIPGLVDTLLRNIKRQHGRVRLFETGLRFMPGDNVSGEQTKGIAGLIYGTAHALSWQPETRREVDFFDIKGDLEALLTHLEGELSFAKCEHSALHPGQSAKVLLNENKIGVVGALHPGIAEKLGISKPVFVFELDLALITGTNTPSFKPLSKFPAVSRDLAILIDRELPVKRVEQIIRSAASPCLKNLKLFDLYSGEGIDPKRKSVAFNLTFQHPSRTLKEEEINSDMKSVLDKLETELDATLR